MNNPLSEPLVRKEGEYRDDRLFYIGCDDRYAPDQYFGFFKMPRIKICMVPEADNLSHAHYVLEKLKPIKCEADDEKWMVLDTDHCTKDNHFESYEKALSEARRLGIHIAISCPCFEVWLAFHRSTVDEVVKLTTADACSKHLSEVANGYDKTKLRSDAFTIETLSDAYHRAATRDAEVAGGDKPDGVTTRVYQVWHNILLKALASQLPDSIRGLADEVKASGRQY